MLEIRKSAITLEEADLLQLQFILARRDPKEAMKFLKKSVYDRLARSKG